MSSTASATEGEAVHFDVLVVGSGVAGCSAATKLAAFGARVGLVTKATLGQSTTQWAQGGIAAVFDDSDDSTELHLADTLRAGAGLCDEEATSVLVAEGAARVRELAEIGAQFDLGPGGGFARALEGGHSRPRVIHAGGAATGAEVARSLVAALDASPAETLEGYFALDLVTDAGRCRGLVIRDKSGATRRALAPNVVLASGGAGQLFEVTTNPPGATGDGIAMALRAGVPVADLEFMQFHPTALSVAQFPRPLLSEALRGDGAVLRGTNGERFVDELAPRDVVSRAIAERMAEDATAHVYLDATGVKDFDRRFVALAAMLAEAGLEAGRDWLPVAPAAHYLCGGVLTDLDGASALPGLYAVGEVACSGVHGANRLASNSLLEGLVFGSRAAEAILADSTGPTPNGALGALLQPRSYKQVGARAVTTPTYLTLPSSTGQNGGGPASIGESRAALQQAMSERAGIVRNASGLESLAVELEAMAGLEPSDPESAELVNLVTLGSALVASALERGESRGAHHRSDYPSRDDDRFRSRLVHFGPARFAVETLRG